jgi:signal recognition particle subunit SRP54
VEGRFTFENFLDAMQQMKKMGPLQGIIGMLPGVPKELKQANIDDKELDRVEAIIRSMTPAERLDPSIINGSRRLRIANGSGSTTAQVNLLLKQFDEMQRQMASMGLGRALAKSQGRKGKKAKKGGRVTPRKQPSMPNLN